jgi:hypothetical protein
MLFQRPLDINPLQRYDIFIILARLFYFQCSFYTFFTYKYIEDHAALMDSMVLQKCLVYMKKK